jgi:hypothetical protein
LRDVRLPLEIRPTKGGPSTLYLRIPKDIIKIYGIDQNTNFTFELIEGDEGTILTYKLEKVNKKRKENEELAP